MSENTDRECLAAPCGLYCVGFVQTTLLRRSVMGAAADVDGARAIGTPIIVL